MSRRQDPLWINMRLEHWRTTTLRGDAGWERVGSLVLDGKPMLSTANCTGSLDHSAALWSPIMFLERG